MRFLYYYVFFKDIFNLRKGFLKGFHLDNDFINRYNIIDYIYIRVFMLCGLILSVKNPK